MTATLEHSHGRRATGSPAERFTSRDPEAFEVPRGREEEWRFTPVRRIREFLEPLDRDGTLGTVSAEVTAPSSVSVLRGRPQEFAAFGRALQPADRVSALAMAHAATGLSVQIPSEAELSEPIIIVRSGEGGRSYDHSVIEVGRFAKATVVLDTRGSVHEASNVEFVVGDGASLTVVVANDAADDAIQLSSHSALVGRDATFRHVVVNLGGAIVRLAPTVKFEGPGGKVEMLGVSFAGPGQHLESRLYVDHSVPNCTSDVLYKSALIGETARTVWIGDVRIRPSATGTQTYELNRNLLLTDGARADSVPNLEIETGEIAGAGHASATGRFDDLQLFYLQSRGIPAAEAQRLVVRGFFADIVERIGLPDLEQRLMGAIEERLAL